MPAVTEPSRPSGLPMASTVSPTCSALLSPNFAGVEVLDVADLYDPDVGTAASVPITLAGTVVPSEKFTFTCLPAPATTWLLVMMYPSEFSTIPEPSPVAVVIATTLGLHVGHHGGQRGAVEYLGGAVCRGGRAGAAPVVGVVHDEPADHAAATGQQQREQARGDDPTGTAPARLGRLGLRLGCVVLLLRLRVSGQAVPALVGALAGVPAGSGVTGRVRVPTGAGVAARRAVPTGLPGHRIPTGRCGATGRRGATRRRGIRVAAGRRGFG